MPQRHSDESLSLVQLPALVTAHSAVRPGISGGAEALPDAGSTLLVSAVPRTAPSACMPWLAVNTHVFNLNSPKFEYLQIASAHNKAM